MVSPITFDTPCVLLARNRRLKVICKGERCTHEAYIDPQCLIDMGWGNLSLSLIESRLKCSACGAAKPAINYLT